MSDNPIVDARALVKVFRKGATEIRPLNGLDLQVPEGQCLALMGPSGSGKSTLLNIIGGLDQPDAGTCLVAGKPIATLSERELCSFRAAHIGFVFQAFNLVPILTAAENVELPLRLLPLSAARRREQVATALEIVGLSNRADHLPSQLSGGEEQRVAIARAFATDPELILADEPTGDLDEVSGDGIVDVLTSLSSDYGKTVVMVTHDAHRAQRADRILYFERGRLTDRSPRARPLAEGKTA